MKQAMAVQSAHLITADYTALSVIGADGMLLMDRTERKLKLIHSLGELQPNHTYTTEYGNRLERTTKFKALLADSIELPVTSDEADFDAALARIALEPSVSGAPPSQSMRMAAYEALANPAAVADAPANGAADDGSSDASRVNGRGSEADAGRLVEEEALQRLTALVERMAEMVSASMHASMHTHSTRGVDGGDGGSQSDASARHDLDIYTCARGEPEGLATHLRLRDLLLDLAPSSTYLVRLPLPSPSFGSPSLPQPSRPAACGRRCGLVV